MIYFNLFLISILFIAKSINSIDSIQSEIELKTKISKLIIDNNIRNNGDRMNLYVSSKNYLYKITEDEKNELKIDKELVTGPKLQKLNCQFSTDYTSKCTNYICDEEKDKVSVDYENRLLLIDSKNQHLIECGTTDYGGCRLRQLNDLSIIGCNYSAPVIPFNSASGVITQYSNDESSLYLMISNEYDKGSDKSEFPVFSVRNLAISQPLSLFHSKYPIESMHYDQTLLFNHNFHMKIIYSFKHNGFIYFLFTITNKILSESCNRIDSSSEQFNQTIVTRMLRICDTKWSSSNRASREEMIIEQISNSYSSGTNSATLTETVIECEDQLNKDIKFNLLQSAHFHSTSNNSNIQAYEDDSILFLTFNSSTSSTSSNSAVCKIKIKEIDQHFVNMLEKCLDGDNSLAELVSPYSNKNTWKVPCRCSMIYDSFRKSSSDFLNERKLFCHNDIFNYMNSRQPLTIKSINLINTDSYEDKMKSITSITSLNTHDNNKIVLALARLDAQLIFYNYDINENKAYKYDQINLVNSNKKKISSSSALSINLAVMENEKILYATYDNFLYRINLKNCEQYNTCEECLGQNSNRYKNPFCGWCMYEQKCMLKQTCQNLILSKKKSRDPAIINNIDSIWLNDYLNGKCPSILDVRPSKYLNPLFYNSNYQTKINKDEKLEIKLNIDLLNGIDYYCVLNLGNQKTEYSVKAERMNLNTLICDLMLLKNDLEKSIEKNPIQRKFLNITLDVKTIVLPFYTNLNQPNKKIENSAKIISNTDLFAFNCTYFKDCSQCLNKKLNGNCVWCPSSSKCFYSSQQANQQCSTNPIEYSPNDDNNQNNFCTSFSLIDSAPNLQNPAYFNIKNKLEIAYSGDTNITLMIRNPRSEFQSNFICVFTRNRSLNNKKLNKLFKVASSNLIRNKFDSIPNTNNNLIPFSCKYSPYLELDSNLALQTVYLSVWWSNGAGTKLISNRNQTLLLDGWNQVQFKQNDNVNDINKDLQEEEEEYNYENNFIDISVVNCKVKASSCGKCMDQQLIDLGCGWCKLTNKCTLKKDCPNLPTSLNHHFQSNWMNDLKNGYCPDPRVIDMEPKCGPKLGAGTHLSLIGENLGNTPFDVQVKMRLLNNSNSSSNNNNNNEIDCSIINEKYVKSAKIVCKTRPITSLNKFDSYLFSVYVHTNTLASSNNNIYSSFNQTNQFIYKYVIPQVISIETRKGIRSGGTILKIIGKHLSCGSDLKFIMDENANSNCSILNITKSNDLDVVYCRTPPASSLNQKLTSIQIKMDDYIEKLNESQFGFEYLDDPKIVSFEPDRTIASGGLNLTLRGKDFNYLQNVNLIISPSHLINPNYRFYYLDQNEENLSNNNLRLQKSILKSTCTILNSTIIQCLIPEINDIRLKQSLDNSVEYYVYIQFNDLSNKFAYQHRLNVFIDPEFDEQQEFSDKSAIIFIRGKYFLLGAKETDYKIFVGDRAECNITSINMNLIACLLPDQAKISKRDVNKLNHHQTYEVKIKIGQRFIRTVGLLRSEKDAVLAFSKYDVIEVKYIIIGACLLSMILFVTMISCFVTLKRRQNKQIRQLKRMQTEFENLEMRVARECKEAFTELQMDIGELANTLNQTGAPFNDFQTYSMKILFPNASESERYYLTSPIDFRLGSGNKENVKNGVLMFSQLILNKKFLLTFIHTLESDTQSFLLQDRINLASYLSICLHDRMDYFTDILMTLLGELIERTIESKNNPKILLRRNESIAEKMLTNWFAFLLYDFIKDCSGTPLYILFLSLKQQIYKGPVDSMTCEARYSLSEDKLIRHSIEYDQITIRAQLQDFDHKIGQLNQELTVKCLNCDTITQVKEKILDAFFKGYPFSKRPHMDDLDLVYIAAEWNNKNSRLILYDEDKTSKIDSDDYKRLNTLSHYKITNGSLLVLVPRTNYQLVHSTSNYHNVLHHQISSSNDSNSYRLIDTNLNNKNAENMTLLSTSSSKGSSSPPTYSKLSSNEFNANGGVYSAMNGSSVGLTDAKSLNLNNNKNSVLFLNNNHHNHNSKDSKTKKYHLIKPNDLHNTTPSINDKSKQQTNAKLVSEVYLTRLLATKGGMQSYVDDFFESVFSTAHGSNVLPFAIKHLFDFLDEQANIHGIADPDVVYTWKSNSLPLRFWVNIIKNPDFVFDIYKSNIVDASLSVIASTFMDSCSQSRLDLNKESPSGKLLFYKEVHKYRKWVESYYSEIKMMPRIDNQDLNEILCEESKKRHGSFNKNNALYRLYNDYVKRYRVQIEKALNDEYQEPSIISINKHLNYRLQQVIYLMDAIEV